MTETDAERFGEADVLARIQPGRTITGMSAVLLPVTPDGEIDWSAAEAHIARTVDAGLTPAVNMDTGYVQLLTDAQKTEVLDRATTLTAGGLRCRRLRRRPAWRRLRPRRLPRGV